MDCKRSLHAFIVVSIIGSLLCSDCHVDADGNACKYSHGPCTKQCNFVCSGFGFKYGGHCKGTKCCCKRAASDLQSPTSN
ncbi:hypothetical protein Bca4012_099533 [Brassica carinata]